MTLSIALLSLAIILCFFTFFTVEQQSTALIQRFGKFVRVSKSGLNLKIPFIESLVGIINLRVQQLDVKVETKTEDNVFVHIIVSVQFFANPDKIYEAFYKLDKSGKLTPLEYNAHIKDNADLWNNEQDN